MANSAQAKKRAKQNEKRRQHNAARRSKMRTFIKAVRNAIATGDKEKAQTALTAAVPVMDRMAGQGLASKNAVARYKSRLNSAIRAL